MDWELSKENLAPVKNGRKKSVLSELVDPADSATKEALEQKRRQLRRDAKDYTGDDPLEPWQRLIKWTLEHITGGKVELQKVLEECTQELMKHTKYFNDIRFLRVWIQYADCLPDPSDVFLFLKEKQIGQEFALFYEAYATYFELRSNCSAADAVYQDGINRMARPLERLKQKYHAFQNRMHQRIQRKIQEEALLGPSTSNPEPARQSLGTLAVAPRAGAAAAPLHRQQPVQQPAPLLGVARPGVGGSSLLASLLNPGGSQQTPKPQLEVLPDDEGVPSMPGYSAMPQVSHLKELKPYGVIRKENTDRPAMWAGTTFSSSTTAAPQPPAKLEMCVDDEFLDEPAVLAAHEPQSIRRALDPGPAQHPAAGAGFAAQQPGLLLFGQKPSTDQRLAVQSLLPPSVQQQPAKSSSTGSSSGAVVGPGSAVAQPSSSYASATGQDGYDPALLVGPQSEELSFEEVRAKAYTGRSGNPVASKDQSIALDLLGGSIRDRPPQAAAGVLPGPKPLQPPAANNTLASILGGAKPQLQGCSLLSGSVLGGGNGVGFAPKPGGLMQSFFLDPQSRPAQPAGGLLASILSGAQSGGLAGGFPKPPMTTTAPVPPAQPLNLAAAFSTAAPPPSLLQPQAPAAKLGTGSTPGLSSVLQPLQPPAAASKPWPTSSSSTNQQASRSVLQPREPQPAHAPLSFHAPPAALPAINADVSMASSSATALAQLRIADAGSAPHPTQPGTMGWTNPMAPAPTAAPALRPREAAQSGSSVPAVNIDSIVAEPSRPTAAAQPVHDFMDVDAMMTDCMAEEPATAAPGFALEPTVTISTQAAFDCLNDMFNSDLAHQPAAKKHHHEPTVTINTKEAFDALNDMFNDQLPHEDSRGRSRSLAALPAAAKPITATDVCRLANLGRPGAGRPSNALALHEDTEFFTRGMPGRRSSIAPAAPAPVPAAQQELGMYEDTCFLTTKLPATRHASGTGLDVREDTEFVGGGFGMGRQGSDPPATAVGGGHGNAAKEFNIYEDTTFVRPTGAAAAAGSASGGMTVYEDTEVVQRPGPGRSMVYEDTTQFVGLGAAVAAAAGGGAGEHQSGGGAVYEDTEMLLAGAADVRRFQMYKDTVTLAAAGTHRDGPPAGARPLTFAAAPPHGGLGGGPRSAPFSGLPGGRPASSLNGQLGFGNRTGMNREN